MSAKDWLGYTARDIVTGFQGTVIGYVTYITGSDQCLLIPTGVGDSNKYPEQHWFDVERLQRTTAAPLKID